MEDNNTQKALDNENNDFIDEEDQTQKIYVASESELADIANAISFFRELEKISNNDKNIRKVIGNRINTLLAEHNKTQKALADKLGVKPNVISYFCKGARTPNTEQLVKIARFFKVSADYLLGFTDNETTNKDLDAFSNSVGLSEKAVNVLQEDFEMVKCSIDTEDINIYKILSWLIANRYIYSIARSLYTLEKASKKFINLSDINSKKKSTGDFKDMYKIQEEMRNTGMECDLRRYDLIRISEMISNHFDQREQVKNNGNNNPTNK